MTGARTMLLMRVTGSWIRRWVLQHHQPKTSTITLGGRKAGETTMIAMSFVNSVAVFSVKFNKSCATGPSTGTQNERLCLCVYYEYALTTADVLCTARDDARDGSGR